MEQPASGPRRRSDGSVRECLFFPVLERNEQERLEALMKRSMERSLQLDHQPKRWTWGGPTLSAGQEDDFVSLAARALPEAFDPTIRKSLSSSSTPTDYTGARASQNPHRSPYRAPLSHLDQGKTSISSQGLSKESVGTAVPPEIPQRDIPGEVRGAVSPVCTAPARRAESPATPSRGSSPRAQSRPRRVRSSNSRAQSPCTSGQYPSSPLRHRATTPGADSNKKWEEEEKGTRDIRGHGSLERKTSKSDTPEKTIPKSSSRDLSVEKGAELSPVTLTGKPVAGTTDAEEASRLLAERRRQARQQKEQEEKQRLEREVEERMRAEELQKKQAEERIRQDGVVRQAAEERQRQEQERTRKEEEERQQREHRWMELQAQLEREREETEQQVRKEAERHRQERELLKLQEEQERLQRKKKEAVQLEPPSPVFLMNSLPSPLLRSQGAVQVNGQVGGHSTWMKATAAPLAPLSTAHNNLGPLHMQSCGVDEFPDEVQSMDVSPVSKEDLISILEFSPVDEVHTIGTNNTSAMEDLLDLTGHVDLGDCNKNLIKSFCNPGAETQIVQTLIPPSDKLNIQ
ncbi:MAP7 domain-containing protein 2-like isoform X2 [Anguilla anguilla]|uniref:MAP7 domain-containing protein 2-like isoform X2 n=1 Tax=Anguilla anguilla TaxID=7936 RepID=UPI0015B158B4|nr:MAP7 domain-containing protein 2-like isoform X2 [Anguilla anguilla]